MRVIISIILIFLGFYVKAQISAGLNANGSITLVADPNFIFDQVVVYRHVYYLQGSNFCNTLDTYDWRVYLPTNGSGCYHIHSFIYVYKRLQDNSLGLILRKKYYTVVYKN